jgi:hypothetical protein
MSDPDVLELVYLGERTYLHGTTLFDSLTRRLGSASDISFRVSRLIQSDRVALEQIEPGSADAVRYSARLDWSESGGRKGIGIVALAPSGKPMRLPFDEASILQRAHFEGSAVHVADQGEESPARVIVALNKALLLRLLAPPQLGQWLFVRLDLDRYQERFAELRLVHRTSVGFAAVSSSIEIDGRRVGTVVFSWLRK